MKKFTEKEIKFLQKKELFNVQNLFKTTSETLQDFIEDNDVCQMVFNLLPNFIDGINKNFINIGIYSNGNIELS